MTSRRGALLCFCKGLAKGTLSTISLKGGETFQENICDEYNDIYELASWGTVFSSGTSVLVVLINMIMRKVFIFVIQITGFDKNSQEATATMTWILIVTFFNYGILYIIAPWNLANQIKVEEDMTGKDYFTGIYTDFSPQWFNDIGSLIAQTTTINIVSPIAEFLLFMLVRIIGRMRD